MSATGRMSGIESIELARAYVALSNAHRVDLILPLFHPDAIYLSSAVGEFIGPEAITTMMRGFFSSYPDVYWETDNFRYENNRVSFSFKLCASAADSGIEIRRQGIETIEFESTGLIKRLEVRAT